LEFGAYMDESPQLYPCEPDYWKNKFGRRTRIVIGYFLILIFELAFISIIWVPIFIFLPLFFDNLFTKCLSALTLIALLTSLVLPPKEWIWARKLGQLWYELFSFSCNLSPAECQRFVDEGNTDTELNPNNKSKQYIIGMHPHGILPFHAILWSAYCDQYMQHDGKSLYGFGAVADVTLYIPFLRNFLGWLAAGSASYGPLIAGLRDGKSPSVNAANRIPRNLYLLPGGVAEIYTSKPRRHAIVFKNRRGLIKLSIESGAYIIPTYVFGASDFFHNLTTNNNFQWLMTFSRRIRCCLSAFWGPFGLPIPFIPRLTMCAGKPIAPPTEWEGKSTGAPCPPELIEAMHAQVLEEITRVFEKYKVAAGYPDGELEVL